MKKIIVVIALLGLLTLCFAGCSQVVVNEVQPAVATPETIAIDLIEGYFDYLDDASANHCTIQYITPVVTEAVEEVGIVTLYGVVNGCAMYITGDVAPFTSEFTVMLTEDDAGYQVVSIDVDVPDAARY